MTYPNRIIAIDLETTGLSPQFDWITQIGAAVMEDGEIVGTPFYTRVQANMEKVKLSPQALAVQIGDLKTPEGREMLCGWLEGQYAAPTSREVALQFVDWCNEVGASKIPNVAQHAPFDYSFISNWQFQQQAAFSKGSLCPVWIDTKEMGRLCAPGGPQLGYGLDALCVMLGIEKRTGGHDALQDAILCGQVYFKLRELLTGKAEPPPFNHDDLMQASQNDGGGA